MPFICGLLCGTPVSKLQQERVKPSRIDPGGIPAAVPVIGIAGRVTKLPPM